MTAEMNHLQAEVEHLEIANARLRRALDLARPYAVCNCPEDPEEGRVTYHSNCHRKLGQILDEALKS